MYQKDMEKKHNPAPLKTGVLTENDLYCYAISDTHFFHNNIIEYAGRPENHNQLMFDNWEATVAENNRLLHLGDLAFGRQERLQELAWLPGQKTLLLGNHDRRNPRRYYEIGFKVIKKGFSAPWKDWTIHFVHNPIDAPRLYPQQLVVHGHIHEKNYSDERFINLSVEQINYAPVWLPDILNAKIEQLSK